jgi:pyruvate,orthophosphate dikinase
LPHDVKSQAEMAKELGTTPAAVKNRVAQLHEMNPMLGHRGCRLAVTFPEILEMQVTAITEAVIACREKDIDAVAEIMIPLVGTAAELRLLADQVHATIEAVRAKKKYQGQLEISVGTMIEIPRAALTADEVGQSADFFSFGTNDLTQMTFGYSRDDVNTFLPDYLKHELLPRDPFQSLDTSGVGQLVEMGVKKGRSAKPNLKCGICGEHGGDPDSITFCHQVGLDYVSCSPFRVPIARLAAAQAAICNGA